MRRKIYSLAITGLFCALFGGILTVPSGFAAESNSEAMKFDLRPPDRLAAAITSDSAWTIYATGIIDNGAPDRLQGLIKKHNIPAGSTVEISSPGGSLMAGMKLGQVFRASGFDAEVGQSDPTDTTASRSGQCFSACTLAFLGGRWRFLRSGSIYGVHRFYFAKSTGQDSDVAQMISAAIIQYIRDMGVDPELFSEMTVAGKDDITLIPEKELIRLNVVNNGQSPTVWSVESVNGVIYLKGQRDTAFGVNKFILACSTKGALLTVVLNPVANGPLPPTGAVSLVADDKEYPIENYLDGTPVLHNGSVFVTFVFPRDILYVVEAAHEVGVTFQFARDAPAYWGFRDMRVGDGAKKMPGVLHGCL
jgi:hypothetical protein